MAAMSRGIAVEAGRYGIRCNVVCPGHTVSETVQIAPTTIRSCDHIRRYSPMGRMGTPDDFEGIGVYFMSDWSRFHTGDLVVVEGGWMANAGQDRHLGAAAVAVKVLRVEGMRDDTRTDDERRALEAAEAQPLDMTRRRGARTRPGSETGSRRLRPHGLRRTPRSAARRGRGRRQRVEGAQVDVRGPLHQGRGQPAADPALLVGAPRSAGRHDRAADRRDRACRGRGAPTSRTWWAPTAGSATSRSTWPRSRRRSPGDEPGPDGVDPRWKRADARWQMMRQNEIMAAMHEHSPDHACGENELQIPDFASYQWEWMAAVPGFRDHYLAHDQTPHYRYMRDVLAIDRVGSSRAIGAGCSSRTSTASSSGRCWRRTRTRRS